MDITKLPQHNLQLICQYRIASLRTFLETSYSRGDIPLLAVLAEVDGEVHPNLRGMQDGNGAVIFNMSPSVLDGYDIDEKTSTLNIHMSSRGKKASLHIPIYRIIHFLIRDVSDHGLIITSTFSSIKSLDVTENETTDNSKRGGVTTNRPPLFLVK